MAERLLSQGYRRAGARAKSLSASAFADAQHARAHEFVAGNDVAAGSLHLQDADRAFAARDRHALVENFAGRSARVRRSRARKIFSRSPPGRQAGGRARKRRQAVDMPLHAASGGALQSIGASALSIFRAYSTPTEACGANASFVRQPAHPSCRRSPAPPAPPAAPSAPRSSPSRRSRVRNSPAIGPVSSPASIRMIETPVSASPAMIGALNGRRAAPPRQQRRVQVEATKPRQGERRRRQQQPVSRHDGDIGAANRRRRSQNRGIAQRRRRFDAEAQRLGRQMHRRLCDLQARAAPPARGGFVEHSDDLASPCAATALNAGTAKAGAPMKMTFMAARISFRASGGQKPGRRHVGKCVKQSTAAGLLRRHRLLRPSLSRLLPAIFRARPDGMVAQRSDIATYARRASRRRSPSPNSPSEYTAAAFIDDLLGGGDGAARGSRAR